jgi:CBS domain-containing protein
MGKATTDVADAPQLPPDATIREAANLMRSHGVDTVAVAENGKIAGVVTISTLLELIGRGTVHAAPNRERRTLARRGPRRPDLH